MHAKGIRMIKANQHCVSLSEYDQCVSLLVSVSICQSVSVKREIELMFSFVNLPSGLPRRRVAT